MAATKSTLLDSQTAQDMAFLAPLQKLSTIIDERPESVAVGSSDIRSAALEATKHLFDISVQSETSSMSPINDLINFTFAPSQAPRTRSKGKQQSQEDASSVSSRITFDSTPLKSLFVDGMDEEQVWAQLDLRTKTVCKLLDFVLDGTAIEETLGDNEEEDGEEDEDEDEDEDEEELDDDEVDEALKAAVKALKRGEDVDLDELTKHGIGAEEWEMIKESVMDGSLDDLDSPDDEQDEDNEEEEEEDDDFDEEEEEGMAPLRDPSDEESERPKPISRPSVKASQKKKKGAHPELDDDFFSLSEFNAETERAESKSSSRGRLAGSDSEDEDMDVDLFTNVDLAEDVDEASVNGNNEAELYYADFFEPPSGSKTVSSTAMKSGTKKGRVQFHEEVRVKKIKPTGKNRPLNYESDEDEEDEEEAFDMEGMDMEEDEDSLDEEDDVEGSGTEEEDEDEDEDMEGSEEDEDEEDAEAGPLKERATIDRLKNDLFADDEEVEDDLTTHQRRMAALKEQISELESENVAPKEWVLMGEAASRQRPQNSLLEEDLEFDRVMKAVPVTTEESIKTLEERIKARILENEFDDVVRVRPLEDKPFLPSKILELQDTKSKHSLAQIYENDYVASQTGEAVDDRDGKLKKEHDEIDAMWETICSKLDALCNAYFVPKQAKAVISTVTNVATATLESALPTTKSTSTMLAPEEVFSASSSSLKARSELTPAEKRTQRTKERKLRKRQRDSLKKSVDKFAKPKGISGVKKQKQAALESVVKHGKGVTVVGKKGVADKRKK
ncbi:Mpp10 protein [Agrocybe pediades]|nr:Mpp10 protein [Agrocybe pediades]